MIQREGPENHTRSLPLNNRAPDTRNSYRHITRHIWEKVNLDVGLDLEQVFQYDQNPWGGKEGEKIWSCLQPAMCPVIPKVLKIHLVYLILL